MDSADGLIEAAQATGNPAMLAWALAAYGLAFRDADPVGALNAVGRGLVIAQDSGNRANQSNLAANLCLFDAEHGDPLAAFDYFTVAIDNYHDSGNTYMVRGLLGILAAFFDRLGRYEPGGHHRRVRRHEPCRCTSRHGRVPHRDCSPSQCAR
jgi:hypothetical protein